VLIEIMIYMVNANNIYILCFIPRGLEAQADNGLAVTGS
jgi:hypothetical protein